MATMLEIANLTPYILTRWELLARVSRIDKWRHFVSARGEGDIFTFALSDRSGSIECVCFGPRAKTLGESLKLNQVYMVANCKIEPRKTGYATIDAPFQLQLRDGAKIEERSNEDLPEAAESDREIEWTIFDELLPAAAASLNLNVLGVLVHRDDCTTVNSRTSSATFTRSTIILENGQNQQITITLWNAQAEAAQILVLGAPVLVLHLHAEASGDDCLTLSSLPATEFHDATTYTDGEELLEAFNLEQEAGVKCSLTTAFTGGAGGSYELKLVNTVSLAVLNKLQTTYFRVVAMVTQIASIPNFYLRCPTLTCNAKVLKQNGQLRCSKCAASIPQPTIGLNLVLDIQDYSGSAMISVFNETAAEFLQMSLKDARASYSHDQTAFYELVAKSRFVLYEFRLCVSEDRQGTFAARCFGMRTLTEPELVEQLKERQETNALGIRKKQTDSTEHC